MKTKKHNHTLTNLLKVFVFSLIILMPFIIFIPNAFYYGFNEQAIAQEKTEYGVVYYDSNIVNNASDIRLNNIYYWTDNFTNNQSMSEGFIGKVNKKLILDQNIIFTNSQYILETDNCYMYLGVNNILLYMRPSVNNPHHDIYTSITYTSLNIIFEASVNQRLYEFLDLYYNYFEETNYKFIKDNYIDTTTNMSITDSMSYAWKSTWQNDLFSWTGTTAIYSGINATTSGIGISENSYIANYLAYIFLLTIIYVIVDIILGAFTILTHIFNKEPK